LISPRPVRGQSVRGAGVSALLIALAFGLTGFVFGMHKLAVVTLRHIVTRDVSLSFQEVSDYLPVPVKLDWNVPFIQALSQLKEVREPALTVVALLLLVALGGVFWVIVVRGPHSQEPHLPKLPAPPPEPYASPPTAIDGEDLHVSDTGASTVTDSVDRQHKRVERSPRRFNWLAPVILYIACIGLLVVFGVPPVSEILLRYYHTLGTFHQAYLWRIAVPAVTSSVAIWGAGGLILLALCRGGGRFVERAATIACAAVLAGVAAWCQLSLRVGPLAAARDWSPAILTAAPPYRPDRGYYGVPDGFNAAQLLAKQLKLKFGNQTEQPERPVVLFLPDTIANVIQLGFTEDGLTASPDSATPVREFLERRHYETALSWVAIKHLFNVATVQFDTTSAIEACMTDMEQCPHLSQCGATTRGMLFTCAATPANLALVDRWADERRFAHPTRESKRLIGQLYERFGQPEKALVWYRRADMPKSFLVRVQNEKPLFHFGRISGRLVLNGKPLQGVQIGAVPRRLNGLPPDMEPNVLRARGELIAFRPYGVFPAHYPRPFAFRWISASAVSDASGQFEISDLTEGEYMLVCTLPASLHLAPPVDSRLSVSNPPPQVVVNYRHPARNTGTISFKISK
jgi:hypothetical protein